MEEIKLFGLTSSSEGDDETAGLVGKIDRSTGQASSIFRCHIIRYFIEIVVIATVFGISTFILKKDTGRDRFCRLQTWSTGSDYNRFVPYGFVRATPYDGSGPQEPFAGGLFEIAAFHQIHCLTSILEDFGLLADGVSKEALPSYYSGVTLTWEEHKAHCFNYVRQALMCFADSTAEGHIEGDPHRVADHGVMHVCNDFDALLAWSKEPERTLPKGWRVSD
ncbi:hypothetical protein LY78DRAFT_594554 [Colletotrichum sublineola]|nr:hypothetical protein LY78DRAFT_594554 [Colletotrichum sublineola]